MKKIIAIGGVPSSGTTLVADLLDSIPGFMCPPELYVLCCEEVYRWDTKFKNQALNAPSMFPSGSSYAGDIAWMNRKYLNLLNLVDGKLERLVKTANNVCEFLSLLADHVGASQGRRVEVFCEKTPLNVGWADLFCRTFPDAMFIHVVRSPSNAIQSLIRRGFTLIEATLIYLRQISFGLRARSHPNYIEIKYEDILSAPFQTFSNLSEALGHPANKEDIEHHYTRNTFRAGLPRPKTWTAYSGMVVGKPEPPSLTRDEEAFISTATLWRLTDNTLIHEISMSEVYHALNYNAPPNIRIAMEGNSLARSKILEYNTGWYIFPEDNETVHLANHLNASTQEILRLRRKIEKLTRGPSALLRQII